VVRSFPDSGALIDAARGAPPFDRIAFDYLDDFRRTFLTSPFVRLEVLPKAAYHRRADELGRVDIHLSHKLMAAMLRKDMKLRAVLS
jgi:hypothetical protein